MIIDKIIKLLEGQLSSEEGKSLEVALITNPDLFELIGGLNRIKKSLSPDKSLEDYLSSKEELVRQRLFKD